MGKPKIVEIEEIIDGHTSQLADITQPTIQSKYNLKQKKYAPIVTFIDDDGNTTSYTKLFPLFQQKGVPCVAAAISNNTGVTGYMTLAQLTELQSAGWEIASHTANHVSLATVTNDVAESECKISKDYFNANGINCTNLVYPLGTVADSQLDIVAKYYECAPVVTGGTNIGAVRSYKLTRRALGSFFDGGNDLAFYKSQVDIAVANNGWLIFMMHSESADHDATQQQALSDTIDYIKSLSIPILTLKDAYDIRGNSLELGHMGLEKHFIIGPDNEIYTPNVREGYNLQHYAKGVNINSLLSAFPANTVTTTPFTIADVSGFPTDNGNGVGVLVTYSMFVSGTEFQMWYASGSNKIYRRTWSGTAWNVFERVNTYLKVDEITGINISSLISAFPKQEITFKSFVSADASGFPSGAGVLETCRTVVGGCEYQIWTPYNFNQIYRRYWTGTAWTALEPIISTRITPINTFDSSTLITGFEIYKVTHVQITNAGAIGIMPEGRAGTLTTNRMIGQPGYDYQEYRIYNSNNVYKRYADSSNAWTTWYQLPTKIKLNPGITVTINANTTTDSNVTLTGATILDNVIVNFNLGVPTGLVCSCFVSATDTITLRFTNLTASTITITNATIMLTVLK